MIVPLALRQPARSGGHGTLAISLAGWLGFGTAVVVVGSGEEAEDSPPQPVAAASSSAAASVPSARVTGAGGLRACARRARTAPESGSSSSRSAADHRRAG